ncbi:phosphonate ABC transporter, permease protein PhnE, partial [Burkholderia pseudomallei]|nr:phosphonate ABC transporter, permease protein PhnE [Burkholderia pseudomallei]MBF3542790.1 phosphonate ABC transporter, permease protein PhnE [Burkholderia pseudomallei]MBF3602623.1 phosphonate ABC transporter, permease protein PhnE [Burkholderia pseudomallei]MBF3604946.1 phosphonate ABC transporter, permease protein PhnE [Burkholderia pseudomallei]MBF3912583.1 phosphonate ABC transporter, permease protein PhnE [Burkholderia pseudomallei]
RSFNYAQTAALLVIVIAVVTLIDMSSAWLRARAI